MVIREYFSTNRAGQKLYKNYSDKGEYIRKVGTEEVYAEAIDVESANFVYEETSVKIPEETLTREEKKSNT